MIKVNNQIVDISKNSLNISDAIEERTTCSFTVVDTEGEYSFRKGHPVEVYNKKDILPLLSNWNLHANVTITDEDEIILNATSTYQDSTSVALSCNPNDQLIFDFDEGTYVIWFLDENQQFVSSYNGGYFVSKKEQITVPDGIYYLKVVASNGQFVGMVTFSNPELINLNGEVLFSGVVNKPKRTKVGSAIFHNLQCVDWHYAADKRRYAGGHENQLAGDVVKAILTSKLAEEGIVEGLIENGPLIVEARFNYAKVSDCLNSLAEKSGFWWKIDQNKQLHFVSKSTYLAPFEMTNIDMEKGSISLENGNPKYRNRQYIKGGKDITDPQTETKVGDGESQAFVVGFNVAKVPTIEISVNGGLWQSQTVGIRGIDEGKQWYWTKGNSVISQQDTDTPLTSVDKIRITYQGEFDIVAISEIPQEIDNQRAIEGGTGIVEDVEDDNNITSRDAAFQLANAKLEKYGVIGRRLRFKTWKKGLESGQLLKINIPYHNLNTEMLIESVNITKQDNQFWYSIICVEGPINGSWAKTFYNMAQKQSFVVLENISEDQILILLAQFSKTWLETDQPNIFQTLYPGATIYPSTSTYPAFKNEDKVTHVAWFNDTTELGRKALTKQTGADTSEINTTIYLAPFEANETITHIGWFGGWQSTDEVGTGVLVDKQIYDKTKTSLEAIQIDKVDTKGW